MWNVRRFGLKTGSFFTVSLILCGGHRFHWPDACRSVKLIEKADETRKTRVLFVPGESMKILWTYGKNSITQSIEQNSTASENQ